MDLSYARAVRGTRPSASPKRGLFHAPPPPSLPPSDGPVVGRRRRVETSKRGTIGGWKSSHISGQARRSGAASLSRVPTSLVLCPPAPLSSLGHRSGPPEQRGAGA